MSPLVVVLLPIFATAIAAAAAIRQVVIKADQPLPVITIVRRVAFLVLLANTLASLLFGVYLGLEVACCSGERSMWVMPLVMAPIEYWKRFGLAIVASASAVVMFIGIRRKSQ